MTPHDARRLYAEFPDAHYLLCRADNKAPARPWKEFRPCGEDMARHLQQGGLIGVVPATIQYGYTVVDVDEGLPAALALAYPPAYVFPSGRPGRAHLWYIDEQSRPNSNWRWTGEYGGARHTLSGEIRSGNGYVILWHDSSRRLVMGQFDPESVPYEEVMPHIIAPEPPRRRQEPPPQRRML